MYIVLEQGRNIALRQILKKIFSLCPLVGNRHFDNDCNHDLDDQMQRFNVYLTIGCFFLNI